MSTVLVPLANGFEEIEAVSIIDILRRGGVDVVTASLNEGVAVRGAHGITVSADARLADVLKNEYAAIILPGGGEGTQNLLACEDLHARLREQKEQGGLVCAICAAPTVLEAAGVLDEEDATCYPSCASQMGRRVKNVPVIADGQIITGQGPGSAGLFALVVLSHLVGERPTHGVANGLLMELA